MKQCSRKQMYTAPDKCLYLLLCVRYVLWLPFTSGPIDRLVTRVRLIVDVALGPSRAQAEAPTGTAPAKKKQEVQIENPALSPFRHGEMEAGSALSSEFDSHNRFSLNREFDFSDDGYSTGHSTL
jgi:hypothetical protein